MSNESLLTARRALLASLGGLAVNAAFPLTALAGRRHGRNGGCTPVSTWDPCYGCRPRATLTISSPPADLVVDSPGGKTFTVTAQVPSSPTPGRVVATIQQTCITVGPSTDTLPPGWYPLEGTSGSYSGTVTAVSGLLTGSTLTTLKAAYVSVVGQIKTGENAWTTVHTHECVNKIYGHTPTSF